jgi:hypothetical protein
MSQETAKKKLEPKFDLSDGFGKDDISAALGGIWRFFINIFKFILYPYVWITRMLGRSIRFARAKEASMRPLNEDERIFMESIPTFFILVGVFLGILVGIFIAFLGSDAIIEFIDELSLDTIIGGIIWILSFIFEIILTIIGLGNHHMDFIVWKAGDERSLGIIDWIRFFFELMVEIFTTNFVILFLGIGLIGVVLVGIWIIISETGLLSAVVSIIGNTLRFIYYAPQRAFNTLNSIYLKFNKVLSGIVIGNERLTNRNVSFHRKIMLISLSLGLYTFIGGFFVLATQQIEDRTLQITFILIVLIVFGLGVGIIEMFIITRFLDSVSRGRYTIKAIE